MLGTGTRRRGMSGKAAIILWEKKEALLKYVKVKGFVLLDGFERVLHVLAIAWHVSAWSNICLTTIKAV